MDQFFLAISHYRRRKFTECIQICSDILSRNPNDLAAWTLKMQSLTSQVYVDEVEMEDDNITSVLMDDNCMSTAPRPGTSLKKATPRNGTSQGVRPLMSSGRPVTGFVRPGTQSCVSSTLEQATRTPRNLHTARPISSTAGRFIRLGTASMLSSADGPFINLSRLDFGKYSAKPNVAKSLFEYIFHHENDVKNALELANLANKACVLTDWWWKIQLGKCYYRLGLYRDAERQFQSSLKDQPMIDTYLFLGKVYAKIDQPLSAIQTFDLGLGHFTDDLHLLLGLARIEEDLGDNQKSLEVYKRALKQDNMCIEAIACIATNHFYSDQPEISLKFYRRLLQMGVYNGEIYSNVGLCCYYAQQYDLMLASFNRALTLSDGKTSADVWYNIGHVSLGIGDLNLAYQCFQLALAESNDHAESYNNLGVIELRRNQYEMARAFLQASFNLGEHQFEPHFNYAILTDKMGDLQSSYNAINKSLNIFSNHYDSKVLQAALQQHFLLL